MIQRPMIFNLAEEASAGEILKALASWTDLRQDPTSSCRRIYLDSFDWRLHRIGAVLCLHLAEREDRRLELSHNSQQEVCRLPGRARPGFAWDLPDGPLKSKLEPVLEMRRLLPLVDVSIDSTPYCLLDGENKTVARLRIESLRAFEKTDREAVELPPMLLILPVRGYRKAFSRLLGRVEKLPIIPAGETLQRVALEAVGRRELDYSGKIQTHLRPQQEAGGALIQIFQDLLATIRANEEGIRKDLDSEFLHDFRVAIRRTRSALGQLKSLLPTDALAHFRTEFRWLGGTTGPTRDLDVYLLKFPTYQESLPSHVREKLLPLRDFLIRHRRQEQKKLARILRSARYRKLLADWQTFLDDGMEPATASAHFAIVEIAGERLRKATRRVLRAGDQALRDHSLADELHSLRIEGKKLRYLMEFFRTLFPRKQIDALIRSLKVLQDNLGDFNDYEVQQAALLGFAEQMAKEDEVPVQTLMAMGRLVARLERGQEEERARFQACFESFSTPENRRLLKRLFRSEAQAE